MESEEPERAMIVYRDIIKEQIEAFVNKRRNIFAALKMDSEDKGNIQSFSQNFFVTEVEDKEENIQIEEEIINSSPILENYEESQIEVSVNISQSGILPP